MSILALLQSLSRKARGSGEPQVESGNLQSWNNQAVPRPCTYDPVHLYYLTKGYSVRLRAGVKKVTLLRFLLAKLVYGKEGEGLSLDEYLVFLELFFSLEGSPDPNLVRKWEYSLKNISILIPELAKVREFPIVLDEASREAMVNFFWDDPILPKPEAYFGLMGQRELRNSFRVQFKESWIPPKRVERYIGVGYKDKGSRRFPNLDGSPSWQEVATTLANREREQEEAGIAYSAPSGE
jgi:hypothetical protein